jgi:potassium/hydrogen antiporter
VHDVYTFAVWVAVLAAATMVAIFSSRVSEVIRVPAPALFLVGAALASDMLPGLYRLHIASVQQIVTVALIYILFDGGMHIGWRRFRSAVGPIAVTGIAGTFLTAGLIAVAGHWLFGFAWLSALLLGTALAPTDPAVVFSVLGKREVAGRSGVIIEGESGVNDPVGIALMASLLLVAGSAPRRSGAGALGAAIGEFTLQMAVGGGIGLLLGFALLRLVQRVPLPSEALYSLRTLAGAALIYGVATLAYGSGFFAVFVAGIVLGDAPAPYKNEIRRLHASVASLGEIVAFAVLGLTVSLSQVVHTSAWWIGLCLAALLTVVRTLAVGPLLVPMDLARGEKAFVLWAGLKGAVPILLGTFVIAAGVADATLIYHIIFVVVLCSVVVHGGLVPWVARLCRVRMRTVEPQPWTLGMRFRHEPQAVRRFVVAPHSPADGRAIGELDLGNGVWLSLVSRGGALLPLSDETVLSAGDEVVALAEPDRRPDGHVAAQFGTPATP